MFPDSVNSFCCIPIQIFVAFILTFAHFDISVAIFWGQIMWRQIMWRQVMWRQLIFIKANYLDSVHPATQQKTIKYTKIR